MTKRRVVVTGIGLVTPLANGAELSWKKLINGESGINKITHFDSTDFVTKIAGEVPKEGEGSFNADDYVTPKDQKKMDRFIHLAIAAADEAINDSGWKPESEEDQIASGVMIGSGIGGLPLIEQYMETMLAKGPKRIGPFFIPSCIINLASGNVSIKHNFRGPNHAVVTACATGCHAIGDAARLIEYGDADVMVAGGSESVVCRLGIGGFNASRALSHNFNDEPQKASRPWDQDRDGFVMGEGAGIVVLEEYEHAKKRGAKIYGEAVGYGLSGDAHHITAPEDSGRGATQAMKMALKRANINTSDIDYINAHGTSTPLGDMIELNAVKKVFGQDAYNLCMSSTKSSIGHLLGAAGGVEAVFSLMAMRDNIAPPTLNLDNPSEGCDLDLVPHKAKETRINAALSNSFGFGGTNASLVFKKI